ncbi:hypothetical protein HUJ04_013170 [Dendroctonus ponderosae]|nr:hypothetical protein HUJ04_013170 [Dendroctonus ponderosae]KAH1000900.1 hypothetical protein HUJ04_013170 [Dendroctonus ponderosae]
MTLILKVLAFVCFSLVLRHQCPFSVGQSIDNVYYNPYFHFPYGGPYMGFLVAFALPLKVQTPGDIFFSMNFEAGYSLPENETQFTFPPIIAASARQVLYDLFERKLESPSASLNGNLTEVYQEAERQGKKKGRCRKYRKTCSFSILKMFTWVGDFLTKTGLPNKGSS